MKNLPWRPMAKWGGLYLLAVIGLVIIGGFAGLLDNLDSELVGRAAGIGLVLVWGAVFAKHHRNSPPS